MFPTNSSKLTDYYFIPKTEKRAIIDTNQSPSSSTDYDILGDPQTTPTKKRRYAENKLTFAKNAIAMHIFEKTIKFLNSCFHVVGQKELQFEIGKTNAQGPSAKKLVISVDRKNFTEAMHAVHSSALPVLHAYPLKEWQEWREKDGNKPQGILYLHKSYFDFSQNATNNLPKKINNIDSLIEGHARNPKSFRHACITIINQVAHEEIELTEALHLFLKKYETTIQGHLNDFVPPLNPSDQKQEQLIRFFMESVHDLQCRYQARSFILYDQLLHLASTDLFTSDKRKEIYKRKCFAIQKIATLESKALHSLSPARQQLLRNVKKRPCRFNSALQALALDTVKEKNKRVVRQLFCASEEELRRGSDDALQFIIKKQTPSTFSHIPEETMDYHSKKQQLIASYQAEQLAFFMSEAKITKEELLEGYQAYDETMSLSCLDEVLEAKIPMSDRMMEIFSEIFETHRSFFEIDSIDDELLKTDKEQ
ncbi:MAG: hypothetical protein ACSNEK_00735 [Parachlamydiaceae bacterium]